MAGSPISLDKIKRIWNNEVHNPANWTSNMRILRATGMFVGSIILMRNFSDLLLGETV